MVLSIGSVSRTWVNVFVDIAGIDVVTIGLFIINSSDPSASKSTIILLIFLVAWLSYDERPDRENVTFVVPVSEAENVDHDAVAGGEPPKLS